jgi:hypothetical protein
VCRPFFQINISIHVQCERASTHTSCEKAKRKTQKSPIHHIFPPSHDAFTTSLPWTIYRIRYGRWLTKGDTLKELDYILKAGIRHPSEALIIYSLKRSILGLFGDGSSSSSTTSFPPSLKTVPDWDSTFSKSASATPGLREVLDECLEAIEVQVRDTIAETLTVRGLDKPAELAKDMLTNSIKMMKLIMHYILSVYQNLTERSGFLDVNAWGLSTQVVRGMFVYMSIVRNKYRTYRPTTRQLGTLPKLFLPCYKHMIS